MSTHNTNDNLETGCYGCCNLVIWDFLITSFILFVLSSQYLPQLSTFYHVIIALLGAALLVILMAIPYLGTFIQVLFSMFYAFVIYAIIDRIFHVSTFSTFWCYGIGVFCFILALILHFGSAALLELPSMNSSDHSPLIKHRPHLKRKTKQISSYSSYKRVPDTQISSENKLNQTGTLAELIGIYESREREKKGMFYLDTYYIASKDSVVYARVLKTTMVTPEGKTKQIYDITLIDITGKEIKQLNNKAGNQEFLQQVTSIEKEYRFTDCKKFSDLKQAYEYVRSSFSKNISSMQKNIQEKLNVCESHYDLAISLSDTVSSLSDTLDGIRLKDYVKQNASDIVRRHNDLIHNVSQYSKTSDISMLQQLSSILEDCILNFDAYIEVLQDLLDKYEKNHANYQDSQSSPSQDVPKNAANSTYFKGCDTLDKLNKRYRDLVKIYHSDSGNGSDEIFIEVTEEYNILKENIMH